MDAPSVAISSCRFEEAERMLGSAGLEPSLVHMANTGAVISAREAWNNMVRPGVALYGTICLSSVRREVSGGTLRLPVEAGAYVKTRILSLRDSPPISSGIRWNIRYEAPAHVAVLLSVTPMHTIASFPTAGGSLCGNTTRPCVAASQWILRWWR